MKISDVRIDVPLYFVDLEDYCVKTVIPLSIHKTVGGYHVVQVLPWKDPKAKPKRHDCGVGEFGLGPKEIEKRLFERHEDAIGTLGFELMAERDLIEYCLKEIAEYRGPVDEDK